MIAVKDLVKRYAGHTAVAGLTFSVGRREVVGLLGQNGAGKSTTMRILACFMPASSGTATVAGYDVFRESEEVRRRIGYMPENNPLPVDMRVREYLKFRARLKGLGFARSRERVSAVLEQCGLKDVGHKIIGQLSKGFRQRVGLADALVHEPELIILDEPTIGLDPHQIRAVRQLIKDLGKERTVLISTHILPEVEMTCTRVLILHQGSIRMSETLENLKRGPEDAGPVIAEVRAPAAELREALEEVRDVVRVDVSPAEGDYFRCAVSVREGDDARPRLFDLAVERGWKLRELRRGRRSLEDVFVRVTRGDREEEAP
ncbi:MAG: ATP-binding cassette domain-containing protein [Verrucomicrobia bacterium]|nr:ATP-binding cassette domain-containing protein [Verrucomicrobiota bacterium]